MLWKGEKLGGKNTEYLIHPMWWLFTQQFGLRGSQEDHEMRLEDFRIKKGDDGLEFVEFAVRLLIGDLITLFTDVASAQFCCTVWRFFSRILSTSSHLIFLLQFVINELL